MAKYCQTCGTPCDDNAAVCTNCRTPFQPAYQQPAPQPAYQQPMYQQPAPRPAYQQPTYQQPAPRPAYQQPVYQQPAPQPAYQQPVYQQPAPQPAYQQPVYQQPAPQPAPQPVYQQPAPQPAPQPVYQEPAPQPAYQPAPKAPKTSINSLDDVITLVKKNIKWVMVGIAALSLIFFFIHTFGLFSVSTTTEVEYFGRTESRDATADISDVTDVDGFGILTFFNVLFGILCLAAAALCAHGFVKNHMRLSFVPFLKDQPGTYAGSTEFTLANMAVAGGALIALLGYLLFGSTEESQYGISAAVSVSPHWTHWVCVILFGGLVAADILLLRKKKGGAVPQAPQAPAPEAYAPQAPQGYAPQAPAPEAYAPPAQPTGYQQPPMN